MTDHTRVFLVLAFGFVLLGIGLTATGVTWPSVAEDLNRSLAELGVVTLLFGSGYTVSTFVSGRVSKRTGIAPLLIGSAVAASVGLAGLATTDTWLVFLLAVAVLGAAGGFVDAATNTYIAVRRGASEMGYIHGAFGVGAIAGPLLVTALLAAGRSWRIAFAILAVGQLVYMAALWLFARHIEVTGNETDPGRPAGSLRSMTLFWSLVVFFLYAGIAGGAGVWAFTFLTEERGVAEGAGGLAVAAYWGGFTLSRLVLGWMGDRARPNPVLRWSAVATLVGIGVFWWNPVTWVGVTALVFTGFAHGPVFPLEILLTPRRFGNALTATVVGFEIAWANIGGAVLPGLIGFFVSRAGLAVVPPFLFVNTLLLWGAIEALRASSESDINRAPDLSQT